MLFSATGVRLDELTQLLYNPEKLHNPKTTPHLDLDHNVIHVLGKGAGKGKRPRSINFEHETGLALSRYLRARTKLLASHGVESDALWVSGKTAKALGAHGVKDIVYTASNRSGVGHVHPHQLRHSHVDRCIRSGMQEGDIMRIHGWRNRSMLDRYARSTQSERALDSHASYGVGAY